MICIGFATPAARRVTKKEEEWVKLRKAFKDVTMNESEENFVFSLGLVVHPISAVAALRD